MAHQFYMTFKGTKQGTFKGQGTKQKEGRIPGVAFEFGAEVAFDPASGQSTGRHQHTPIVIKKEVDAASPQLLQALATNEVLKLVQLVFFDTPGDGKEVVYHTITLTNAMICRFREFLQLGEKGGPVVDSRLLDEISLTYQKIEMENVLGGTQASDDWLATS
jgi:type VI secretion system secreted protein Hcp